MANKFSKSIGKIYKSSFILSKSGLKSLYYSMVYPYLFYCNIVWASTYKTNLLLTCSSCDSTKVRDQKYNKSAFDASFDPIYKEHRRLKLLGKFMYSYKHSLLPIRFRNTFPLIIRLITTIQEMLLLSSYPSVEQTLDNFLQAIRRGS